jgi:hypothetical protein
MPHYWGAHAGWLTTGRFMGGCGHDEGFTDANLCRRWEYLPESGRVVQ